MRAILIIVAITCTTCSRAFAADHGSRPTIADLARSVALSDFRLRAWLVEYESVEAKSKRTTGYYIHRIVGAKSSGEFMHWSTHGAPNCLWRDDPYQQRLIVGLNSAVIEHPFDRAYMIVALAPSDALPGTAADDPLFIALGWWPFVHRPGPVMYGDIPITIRDVLRCSKYVVSGQAEMGGRPCHVVEYPNHDRLWLDSELGWALVAREIRDATTGALIRRVTASGHREREPGIWVPTEIHNVSYVAPIQGDKTAAPRRSADFVTTLLDVRLNDRVPDQIFRFVPQNGSIRVFDDSRFEQSTPGGAEYLDSMVVWIRGHMQCSKAYSGSVSGGAELRLESLIVLLCSICICFMSLRGRGRRRGVLSKAPSRGTPDCLAQSDRSQSVVGQ